MADNIKIIAKNKRAGYDYSLQEKVEAGIVLTGTEVKSLRQGKVNLSDAYVMVSDDGEAWIYNLSIPPYEFGNINNHEEKRKRKLLLHDTQIAHLFDQIRIQKVTAIPTMIYFRKSLAKIEIALGKGKNLYDKRQDLAKKDAQKKLRRGDYD
ncbi:MAG: SsrA-binding protein SmpB [Pseudomonadota bacterium]